MCWGTTRRAAGGWTARGGCGLPVLLGCRTSRAGSQGKVQFPLSPSWSSTSRLHAWDGRASTRRDETSGRTSSTMRSGQNASEEYKADAPKDGCGSGSSSSSSSGSTRIQGRAAAVMRRLCLATRMRLAQAAVACSMLYLGMGGSYSM